MHITPLQVEVRGGWMSQRFWLPKETRPCLVTGRLPRWLRKAEATEAAHRRRSQYGAVANTEDLSSWRHVRAQLVSAELASINPRLGPTPDVYGDWCHRIAAAEAGCLLLANKLGMGFFERSVILVVETSSERSLGLMLNRLAGVQLQDIEVEDSIKQMFKGRCLRIGGPHVPDNLHLLHGQSKVSDAAMMCPGLYTGGLQSSLTLMAQGAVPATDFSLFAGFIGWQPGQLEDEIRHEIWIPVSADPQTVLKIACSDAMCISAWNDLLSTISQANSAHTER